MPQAHPDLAAALVRLARIKYDEVDLDVVLSTIAHVAKDTIPGTAEVSVTLVQGAEAHTAAYTGDLALTLDEWQYEQGRGPCLDAATTGAAMLVPDMTTESRWPEWAGRAHEVGAASSLSIGLPIQEAMVGALNIYGAAPRVFDDQVELAKTLAGYAAIALANVHLYESTAILAQQMQEAMQSRAVIEQAKGIIMGQRRCAAEEAFAILARVSQDSNRKLRDVAESLVERAVNGPRE
ncbi:GAF and ANTAR domain-containing protein [Micromonospora sp. NBS 11-29]|uniref:GAF and ANTAR domain-containing protein n=1 Tax=Micromonospora sp. NBS 11-29 TaxID=1960879 RepID=UPI000B79AC0B|nr:GAF and ANTAR domain-containing protein [Micromonospora sp. NBS 11-29]